MDNTLRKIIFLGLYVGAALSLIYILSVDVFRSVVLLGLVFYLIVLMSYSVCVNIVGLSFRMLKKMGKPVPDIMSRLMGGRLTDSQLQVLSKDYRGLRDALIHEFILMRLDVIIPAGAIFAITLFYTIPAVTASSLSELVVGEIGGLFVLSYLIYTCLQAFLYSVKLAGSVEETAKTTGQVNNELITNTLFAVTT